MWIESVVRVGRERVAVRVQQLDDAGRARAAVALAWISLGEKDRRGGVATATWSECVEDVLQEFVTFTIPEERLAHLDSVWWSKVVSRALVQLIRENKLMPHIQRHIGVLQKLDQCDQRES